MALYSYRAVDADGNSVDGTMDEPSAARVATILEERGLQVSQIEQIAKRPGLIALKPRLEWDDIQLLNDQLLAATKSHLPLVPALESMALDIQRPRLRKVIDGLKSQLEEGASLDEALERHRDEIPYIYRNLVRAGERSGNLSGVLTIASLHANRMNQIRNSIHMAMAYPAIVFAMTAGFLFLFLYYVMPLYAESFSDMSGGLPWITQFWMDVSEGMRASLTPILIFLAILIVGAPIAFRALRRFESGWFAVDWFKERLPIVGRTFALVSCARFARSLGTLLSSGVPAVESLDLASAASGNGALRRAVREATERVAAGERIADALSDTGYFTHTFCWLLSTGETRGEVEPALFSIAETYERDIRRRDRLIELLMLPVLIVFLGIVLGAVVTSIYLPMFGIF